MNRAEYIAYQSAVENFLGAEAINTVSGLGTTFYSNATCECCRRPWAGMREDAVGVTDNGTTETYQICEDCIYFLEYGRLDDDTMLHLDD